MKTSSAKGKGRRLQQWVVKKIGEYTKLETGKDCMIEGRPMGQKGADVILHDKAIERFPFSVECKNQENWSLPAWIEQAKTNQLPGTNWLLIIGKNRYKPIVILDADTFFALLPPITGGFKRKE